MHTGKAASFPPTEKSNGAREPLARSTLVADVHDYDLERKELLHLDCHLRLLLVVERPAEHARLLRDGVGDELVHRERLRGGGRLGDHRRLGRSLGRRGLAHARASHRVRAGAAAGKVVDLGDGRVGGDLADRLDLTDAPLAAEAVGLQPLPVLAGGDLLLGGRGLGPVFVSAVVPLLVRDLASSVQRVARLSAHGQQDRAADGADRGAARRKLGQPQSLRAQQEREEQHERR
mmetsp:Transcript_3476/g.7798  ORF Transcript_3476/g.7798 Transcript_3476/m.7798 type:complete len:233 (-) Transcript_3476:39-737(-)